jgi:hypothetical protein
MNSTVCDFSWDYASFQNGQLIKYWQCLDELQPLSFEDLSEFGGGGGVIFEYKSLESDYQQASKIINKDV